MGTEIWVAIITGAASFFGVVITVIWGKKKDAERSEEQTKLILYRIGELEKKQDKYNHLQERTYKDEQDIAVMKKEIKAMKERMEYLHED